MQLATFERHGGALILGRTEGDPKLRMPGRRWSATHPLPKPGETWVITDDPSEQGGQYGRALPVRRAMDLASFEEAAGQYGRDDFLVVTLLDGSQAWVNSTPEREGDLIGVQFADGRRDQLPLAVVVHVEDFDGTNWPPKPAPGLVTLLGSPEFEEATGGVRELRTALLTLLAERPQQQAVEAVVRAIAYEYLGVNELSHLSTDEVGQHRLTIALQGDGFFVVTTNDRGQPIRLEVSPEGYVA